MEDTDERDLSGFDKNVMELFDVCKEILKVSEKRNLSLSNHKNPYLNRLEKYIKTYNKTDPVEHVVYFEKIYTGNKRYILLGPQRDSWLLDGNLIISFGEDCGLKTDMKLHLSGIYNTSCKIRDEIRDEIEGLPDASDTKETGFPASYMLTLYRIFREIVTSDNEKTKLSEHIQSMESDAGIRSSSSSSSDPLSGLFDMAANMAEQVSGKPIPRDKMPGQNDFSKMISSVVDNPKTKSMLGSMMQEFQNTNNIGEIVTKLVGGLGGGGEGAGGLGGMAEALSGMTQQNPNGVEGPVGPVGEVSSYINNIDTNTVNEGNGNVNDEFADFD